jgi:hypothetical protein
MHLPQLNILLLLVVAVEVHFVVVVQVLVDTVLHQVLLLQQAQH